MGTTDANGVYFYEDTDAVSPLHTLLNVGQTSVSNALNATPRIFPAADTAARNTLRNELGSSASKPLFVYRQDAARVEWHDGSRWHVTADTTIGRVLWSTGALLGQGYTSITSVNATSLGGPVSAEVEISIANPASSGLPRTAAFRVLCDGVEMTGGGVTMGLPFVSGQETPTVASWTWETTPAAGAHTWVVQASASAGGGGVAKAITLKVVERP